MKIIVLINIDNNLDNKLIIMMIKIWKKYINSHINIYPYFVKTSSNIDSDTIDIKNNTLLIKSVVDLGMLEKIIKSIKCLRKNEINFDYIVKTNISSFLILNKLYYFLNDKLIDYAGENIKGIPVKTKYKTYFDNIDKKNRLYTSGSTLILSKLAIIDLLNETIDLTIDDEIMVGLILSRKFKPYKINVCVDKYCSDISSDFLSYNLIINSNSNPDDINEYSLYLLNKFYNGDELNNDIFYKIKKLHNETNQKNIEKQSNHSDFNIEFKLIDNYNGSEYKLSETQIVNMNKSNLIDFSCINDIIETINLYTIKNDYLLFKNILYDINEYNNSDESYNIDLTNEIKEEYLEYMNNNIEKFVNSYSIYKKILFVVNKTDTNNTMICEELKKIFNTFNCDVNIEYFNDDVSLQNQLSNIFFKPNLIIKFSKTNIDLKNIFNCNIIFIISKDDIDNETISQIKNSDACFSNDLNIKNILEEKYSINSTLFYSIYSPFYGITNKIYYDDSNFNDKIYDFGLVIDDFNNKDKDLSKIIEYLKTKKSVILIGNNCNLYDGNGFKLVNTNDLCQISQYTKNIKYIIKIDKDTLNNFDIHSYINGSIILRNLESFDYNDLYKKIHIKKNNNYIFGNFSFLYKNNNLSGLIRTNSIELYFVEQNQTKDFILLVNLDYDIELNIIDLIKLATINSLVVGYNNMIYSDNELINLYYLYGIIGVDKNMIGIKMFYNDYIKDINDNKHTRKYNKNLYILILGYYYGTNNYDINELTNKLNEDIFHTTEVLLVSKIIKGYGGVQKTSRQLLKTLDLKYNVSVLSNNLKNIEFNFETDFLDYDIPNILIVKLKKTNDITDYINNTNFEFVINNKLEALLDFNLNKQINMICHNSMDPLNLNILSNRCKIDKLFTINNFHRNLMIHNGYDKEVYLYNNYVFENDDKYVNLIKTRTKFTYNIGFIGRLSKEKNVQLIIDGVNYFNYINKLGIKLNLYIIGSGNQILLNLNDNIILLGFLNKDEINKYYNIFDYVISGSVTEGKSFSIIESLHNGIPCIHSNINGINEIVFENQNGFLFQLENYSAHKYNMNFNILDEINNDKDKKVSNIENVSNVLIKAYSIDIDKWKQMSSNSVRLLNSEYDDEYCINKNLNNFTINTLKKYPKQYKIFVSFKPDENQAYGGGNISIYYIIRYILNKYSNFNLTYNLEPDIDLYIIIDPFSDGRFKKYGLDDIIKYRKENNNNKGKIIIRINDCDKTRIITNPTRSREYQIIKNISHIDFLIFNSNFIKSYYFDKFKEFGVNVDKIKYDVIVNGCDQNIFINKDKSISNSNPIKIVTHHWSNNINKGYPTYYELWKYSQTNVNCGFEFVFIGQNVPDMFKEVPIIGPYVKDELADELNKCEIYITDSKYDSCPNHVLEALSCGLPILYSNCEGGAKELCMMSEYKVGEIYNNFNELIEKINIIKNNYNFYRENIVKSKHLYTVENCVSNYYNVFLKNVYIKNISIETKYENNIINIYCSDSCSNLLIDGLNFQLVKGENLFAINKNTFKKIELITNSDDDIIFEVNEFANNKKKLNNDKINVLLCSDEKYFVGLFAVLHSVITNTNHLWETHFNFMIPIDSSNIFSKLLIEFELKMNVSLNKSIIYLDSNIIDKTIYESKCYNGGGHLLNIGNFSRLMIGEFMDYSKLIYLDSDSIVQTDIIKKLSKFTLEYPIYAGCANLINSNKKKQIVIKMSTILNCDYNWINLIGEQIEPNNYVYMGAPFITDCSKWCDVYKKTINIIKIHNSTAKGIYKLFTMSIQNIIFYNKTGNISSVLDVLQDLGSSKKEWDIVDLIDKDILDWSGIYKPWYLNGQYKHIWQSHDIMYLSAGFNEINGDKNTIESFEDKNKNKSKEINNNLNLVSNKYLGVEKDIFNKFHNYIWEIIKNNNPNAKYNILYVCDAKYLMEKMSRVRFWAIEELGKYSDLNLTLTGPGFVGFVSTKTLQQNIIDLGINFDLVIWYKPLDVGYNFDPVHKLPFRTCLRYNEMWDENWTCKEINETMTDVIVCHHYNDYLRYKDTLYKDNKLKKFVYNPHHANKNIFKPLNIEKDIDILISGVTKKTHYPLKYRLFNLINKYKDTKLSKYTIYTHKHPGYNNSLNFENQNQIEYNKIINRSKLCICCTSRYNYRLGKYVEIPMTGSIVVGDLPFEDKRFANFVVEVKNDMSDEEIINILINTLENQNEMDKKIKIGIDWSKNYTTSNYTDNLMDIIRNKTDEKIFIISDEIRENHPEFGGQKWICDILKQEFINKFPLYTTLNANEASIIWYLAPWNYRYIPQGFKSDTWLEFLKTKKVIFTQHHIDEEKLAAGELDKQFEFMKTYGKKLHAICNLTKTGMRKHFSSSLISTQKLWVNSDVFYYIKDKTMLRNKYNFSPDAYLIGSFQKDTEGKTNLPKLSKGPDIFVNIIKDMYKSNNKIEVILTGLRREYIIRELKNAGIKYHYFNMVSLEEINELFNCLNLYIVSSRCEGGPRAVFEAGLTKTPIISTRVGVAPELMARSSLFNADNWLGYKGAKPNVELLYSNVVKLTSDEYMYDFLNYLLK
jgi:glycosyltransferase involved in cell wall biosynthesis